MENHWPKRQSITAYLKQWYMPGARCRQSIMNDIDGGALPGGKEESGAWFIWVWADGSAAHGYTDQSAPGKTTLTGNAVADAILQKHRARAA